MHVESCGFRSCRHSPPGLQETTALDLCAREGPTSNTALSEPPCFSKRQSADLGHR